MTRQLRTDTAQYVDHLIAHLAHALAAARRGDIELGDPFEASEHFALHARAQAPDFLRAQGVSEDEAAYWRQYSNRWSA